MLYLSDGISFMEENVSEKFSITWETVYFMMFNIIINKNEQYAWKIGRKSTVNSDDFLLLGLWMTFFFFGEGVVFSKFSMVRIHYFYKNRNNKFERRKHSRRAKKKKGK